MALSDLAVFTEWSYSSMTEVLAQQVELFNAASAGTITLAVNAHVGDFTENAYYQKVSGLVRRRNPYNTGAVAPKTLHHIIDTMVKVAAGSPPVQCDQAWFDWIKRSPEEAGAVIGQQLSRDILGDMLNVGIMSAYAAMSQVAAVVYDATTNDDSTAAKKSTATPVNLNRAAGKFGDAQQTIRAWVMHSTPLTSYHENGLLNAERLFAYETVNVMRDAFGRIFVITDCPALATTSGTDQIYHTLGLTGEAVRIEQNADFHDNIDERNGDENIQRTYQAEWSYNVGVKGFSWDKANGGKAPTDAALATSTNWDQIATSIKDTAGVILQSKNG